MPRHNNLNLFISPDQHLPSLRTLSCLRYSITRVSDFLRLRSDRRLELQRLAARARAFAFTMSQTYTTADVTKHKDDENGYWLIVENDVYDVSSKYREPSPRCQVLHSLRPCHVAVGDEPS